MHLPIHTKPKTAQIKTVQSRDFFIEHIRKGRGRHKIVPRIAAYRSINFICAINNRWYLHNNNGWPHPALTPSSELFLSRGEYSVTFPISVKFEKFRIKNVCCQLYWFNHRVENTPHKRRNVAEFNKYIYIFFLNDFPLRPSSIVMKNFLFASLNLGLQKKNTSDPYYFRRRKQYIKR